MTYVIMIYVILYLFVYGMIRIFTKEPFLKQIRKCLIGGSIISLVVCLSMFIYVFFDDLYLMLFLNEKIERDVNNTYVSFFILFSTLLLIVGLLMKIIEGQKNEE